MTVGKRLKYLREKADLTQKDVAIKLGVKPSAISKYELDMREPNIRALKNLGEIFDVSIDYLLGRSPDIFVGEADKIELDIKLIKERYDSIQENWANTEIYENDNAIRIISNKLMCGIGQSICGIVSINKSISFRYIDSLLNQFEKADIPRPQVMIKVKNKPDDVIIVEADCFDDKEIPLNAGDRVSLYRTKLSENHNILGLAISIDKNENCKLVSANYQAKGENKYLPLKDLPKTVLTAGEYIDVMSRL